MQGDSAKKFENWEAREAIEWIAVTCCCDVLLRRQKTGGRYQNGQFRI